MMAPIDRKFHVLPLPVNQDAIVDRATHAMLDGDGSGKVSRDEWARAGWSADRFAAFDADGDGSITQTEFSNGRRYEREFDSKDWNKDGGLSRLEFNGLKLYVNNHFSAVGGGMLKAFEQGGKLTDTMLRCMPPMIRDRFMSYDTNRDGEVSRNEYVAGKNRENRITVWRGPEHIMPLNAKTKA